MNNWYIFPSHLNLAVSIVGPTSNVIIMISDSGSHAHSDSVSHSVTAVSVSA